MGDDVLGEDIVNDDLDVEEVLDIFDNEEDDNFDSIKGYGNTLASSVENNNFNVVYLNFIN